MLPESWFKKKKSWDKKKRKTKFALSCHCKNELAHGLRHSHASQCWNNIYTFLLRANTASKGVLTQLHDEGSELRLKRFAPSKLSVRHCPTKPLWLWVKRRMTQTEGMSGHFYVATKENSYQLQQPMTQAAFLQLFREYASCYWCWVDETIQHFISKFRLILEEY